MSNMELAELALILHSTRLEQVAVLMTVYSAYLVTAYIAAKKLTSFQLTAITLIYSVMVLITIAGYVGLANQAIALEIHRSGQDMRFIFEAIAVTNFIGYLLSLAFMWHSRKRSEQ